MPRLIVAAGGTQDDPQDSDTGVERNDERLFYGSHKLKGGKKEPMSVSKFNDAHGSFSAGKPASGNAFPPALYSAGDEPIVELPPGKPGKGRAEMERSLSYSRERRLKDRNLSLKVGALSHPGIVRRHKPNEDSLFAAQGMRTHLAGTEPFGLFLVADGMGGHAYGQEASRLAIQTMVDHVLSRVSAGGELADAGPRHLLVEGVQAANRAIYRRNMEQHTEMGTTVTAALIVDWTAFVVNVGDSRTYLYRESDGLRRVTRDHSVVAYLVEAGIITPDDSYTHPRRNVISRSLGTEPVIQVDAFVEPLQPGDTVMLCSDGLWAMLRDPFIQQLLCPVNDASLTGRALLEAALQGGGEDNASVIVVQVSEALEVGT